eukprot:944693-Amphidinium_carterae.1
MVHQNLVQRYPDSWRKDGRSLGMERAFQKAKAVLQVVTNSLQEKKCDHMEAFMRNRDARVSVKDRTLDSTANKERWSWKDLIATTKLSQEDIPAK